MIVSKEFTFGNNEGEYSPSLGYVTDSIFEVAKVNGIGFKTQLYSSDIVQGVRSLNYSNTGFVPVNGDKMIVYFVHPVIMENA